MQNRWVGDVGDFGKYGLLTRLCSEDELGPGYGLGVVWYLVSEKGVDYLSAGKGRFDACDHDLFAKLRSIVEARSVAAIERSGVLPLSTVFFGDLLNRVRREDWLTRAIDTVKDCQVVFLDPDTGLKDSIPDARRSVQHAYLDEVLEFANQRADRTVVVYHHLGREKHEAQIDGWLDVFRRDFYPRTPFAVRYQAYSPRSYFVIPSRSHEKLLKDRVTSLISGEWGERGLFQSRVFGTEEAIR